MKTIFLKIIKRVKKFIVVFFSKIFYYYKFIIDFIVFKRLSRRQERFINNFAGQYPCLMEKTESTSYDPHYTYHLAWAARMLAKLMPPLHIDISSGLTFSTVVSAFIPIKFYDYRPADIKLDNFFSGKADLVALPFADNSIGSLSCMHVVEHVGLGRYGDSLNPNGDLLAISELVRVLAPGGRLLFVVPVGRPMIRFNAHRIYSFQQIKEYFSKLKLERFDLLTDQYKDGVVNNATPELVAEQSWGCGCFLFVKSIV